MLGVARHVAEVARSAATRSRQQRDDAEALGELQSRRLGLPAGLELDWLGVSQVELRGTDAVRRPRDRSACRPPALFGCSAYGSASLAALMRLHGLGAHAVEVEPYKTYELGPFQFSFTPSAHSKLLLGLAVPFAGELTCDHLEGLSPSAYRCGQVWGIRITVAGVSFYHQGSADLIDDAVRGAGVDVFLAGIAGRNFTRDYWARILPRLDPRVVVPTHYDDFFKPLDESMGLIANVKLCELPRELEGVSRDVTVAAVPRMARTDTVPPP